MFSHTLTTALEQLCPLSHNSCLNFLERVTLMHELYRVLSAISADTFSQHFRAYFIIPCNPMFYKHLKLLRRPQRSGDIRTVRAWQGSNIEKRAIHRMTLFSISLRARDGIRTLPMSGKLLKSRRNAHCLRCVYRLSTTCKSERKAVKGSAEQIHLAPLLLFVVVEILPIIEKG